MTNIPTTSLQKALREHVTPGDRVLLGTGAGVPRTMLRALAEQPERWAGIRLLGGMQLGEYDFLAPVKAGLWTFDSWQVMPPIRAAVEAGTVGLIPCRGALVPELIESLRPDVFLTTVSPPDHDGTVSLGASVSYALQAAGIAPRTVAAVNPEMPRVHGNTRLDARRLTALVIDDGPLPSHEPPAPDATAREIARHVALLLDENVTLQIGLGSVPEALVDILAEDPPGGLRVFGMGIEGMIPLLEAATSEAVFVGGELLGTSRLYRFAHENRAIHNYPISEFMRVPDLAAISRFVSLNGAIQVDVTGQVNSEWIGGRHVSAPGGAFDFVDGANFSRGGLSIIALRSTARGGQLSTIVPSLEKGAPVTIPRHAVEVVVTEYGIADLRGRTLRQRAAALASVAHPAFREGLAATAT